MAESPILIKRYPNRRYYAKHQSKYVSLRDIEEIVRGGDTVEIRDSQTGEDLTRAVLTQLIMERQPEKMLLFPSAMLHFILRSNDAMADFMRDYFRHSLTYLDYLQRHSDQRHSDQRHSDGPAPLSQPMHWVKAWLDGIAPRSADSERNDVAEKEAQLAQRVEQLEDRIRQLEKPRD